MCIPTPTPGPPLTFGEAMRAAVREHGDQQAYVEGARTLTFAEWDRAAAGVAERLAGRGVRPGEVVALLLPSGIDFAIAYAAVLRLGAVVTAVNTRLGAHEVGAILRASSPALVVRDDTVPWPAIDPGTRVIGHDDIDWAAAPTCEPGPASTSRPDDAAVIIWTSGTTGVPKGAWYDHRGLAAAVATAGAIGGRRERRLFSTPFAHAGYLAKVVEQLVSGSTLVVSPQPWSVQDMARLLVDERIDLAGGVPTQWAKLLTVPGLDRAVLPHLRVGVAATAPASPELVEAVRERLGCSLVVRYAMTEAPSITGTDPADPPAVQSRTVGRPQAGMAVRIVDADDVEVGGGETGHVQVRGACVMRGYWQAPALTEAAFCGDWLRTGDLGWIGHGGNLVLVGRSKEMYIRGGYNVYPLEVEHELADHPKVARVAVIGVETPVLGERGMAWVVPTDPDDPPTLRELREHVGARLADYKSPDDLRLVPELPVTAMLKVDKTALQRLGDPGSVDVRVGGAPTAPGSTPPAPAPPRGDS